MSIRIFEKIQITKKTYLKNSTYPLIINIKSLLKNAINIFIVTNKEIFFTQTTFFVGFQQRKY